MIVEPREGLCMCITDEGKCQNTISDTEIGHSHLICDVHGGVTKNEKMERTKEENEQKLAELAEKYKDESSMNRMLMTMAIGFTKIFDGTRKLGEYNPELQGPHGTWAEVVDQDMGRYEEMFNELAEKYTTPAAEFPVELKWAFKLIGSAFMFNFTDEPSEELKEKFSNMSEEDKKKLIDLLKE
jgi:Family of unknown function (DUF5767)